MRLAVGGEREAQRLLGAGLADRAGDGDHFAPASARARRAARSRKASSTSSTTSSGASAAKRAALRARDHRKPGAGFERGLDEIVAVAVVAL